MLKLGKVAYICNPSTLETKGTWRDGVNMERKWGWKEVDRAREWEMQGEGVKTLSAICFCENHIGEKLFS